MKVFYAYRLWLVEPYKKFTNVDSIIILNKTSIRHRSSVNLNQRAT
jgi:hypothetical protein